MKHFITFEGIDGSGKSTITKMVYEKLKKEGYDVVLTYEPTDSPIGKYVQACIKNKSDPYVTSFAFIADRVIHCIEIKKWLKEGRIILCDRYADSTYAYQGAQLESTLDDPIRWLQDLSEDLIITPDRTFLLIIEPEKALKRIDKEYHIIFDTKL
jgi:dTMP kinase